MTPEGTCEGRFAGVRDAFADVLAGHESRGATGAALAVWHEGAWVVDLWGGHADAARTRPWTEHTLVMPYSVTKPFAAVAALVLVDRGLVDLDAPLSSYWPALGGGSTLRHVLAHASGYAWLERPAPTAAFFEEGALAALLADQATLWEAGAAFGEAALTYGALLGEVVRRVDGRTLGTFLREEVCGPHGLDVHVGVQPEDLDRVADLTEFGEELHASLEARPVMARALANPPGALDPDVVNSEAWRRAEVAAVNGHVTARGVAGLFVALEQERLLSDGLRRALVSPVSVGVDRVLGEEAVWGLGVALDVDGYGMGGLGGSLGWWSTDASYALGFVTGLIADHDDAERLDDAVRGCLGLPPH